MCETGLADFFLGRATARELADDVRGPTRRDTAIRSTTEIENVSAPLLVTRDMAIALCDAVLCGELPPERLKAIGFALIASDKFYRT